MPNTIEELITWYKEQKFPPYEETRIFIGEDYRGPRAFGIFKKENCCCVYKNREDGSRIIRYEGEDEAKAVGEIYNLLAPMIKKTDTPDPKSGIMENQGSLSRQVEPMSGQTTNKPAAPKSISARQAMHCGGGCIAVVGIMYLAILFTFMLFNQPFYTLAITILPPLVYIAATKKARGREGADWGKRDSRFAWGFGTALAILFTLCLIYLVRSDIPTYYLYESLVYCEYKDNYYLYEADRKDYKPVTGDLIPLVLTEKSTSADYVIMPDSFEWKDAYLIQNSPYFKEHFENVVVYLSEEN